jgi:lysophospholipase L1-like esterase
LTPIYSAYYDTNLPPYAQISQVSGKSIREYADAIIECAKAMNVPFIDLCDLVNVNRFNYQQLLFDQTHPNLKGFTIISEIIENYTKSILSYI